ncbi:hypothetical protein LI328DRAFT_171290 [Trichoderma asperelloides]|nr:hypothetical protein LI328DRAFT_171290 [Trichoderma asperelloides]
MGCASYVRRWAACRFGVGLARFPETGTAQVQLACWAGGKLHDADLDSCSWPSCELRRELRARLSPSTVLDAVVWMLLHERSARPPVSHRTYSTDMYLCSRRLPTWSLHHFLPDIGTFSPARLHKRGRAISSRPCMASAESGCQRWADEIGQ